MMARGTPDDQYTNATSVIYRVYFSEAVTGVDASDFYLYLDPGLGGTIGTVTGSGAEYSVEVNTITGDGSMFPNVYTSGTDIADAANNHLSGGFNNSMSYIFDHTAPSVQSINRFDPSTEATTATTLVYRGCFLRTSRWGGHQ
jgi:hypothetical protein